MTINKTAPSSYFHLSNADNNEIRVEHQSANETYKTIDIFIPPSHLKHLLFLSVNKRKTTTGSRDFSSNAQVSKENFLRNEKKNRENEERKIYVITAMIQVEPTSNLGNFFKKTYEQKDRRTEFNQRNSVLSQN